MIDREQLLDRLAAIGESLAACDDALALLALGSVGEDRHRLDAHSDLDFFAIVEPGAKSGYVDDLDWLSSIAPVAYAFRNTPDGHKLLYADGVFCEFAVFEPDELAAIPFERGHVEWHRDGFDTDALSPPERAPGFGAGDEAFLMGELLTNLYVGLHRYARGERLSAFFFVQHHALVRLLDLFACWGDDESRDADSFSNERRLEQRMPQHAALVAALTPGYDTTPLAAARMLDVVEARGEPDAAMVRAIREVLATDC